MKPNNLKPLDMVHELPASMFKRLHCKDFPNKDILQPIADQIVRDKVEFTLRLWKNVDSGQYYMEQCSLPDAIRLNISWYVARSNDIIEAVLSIRDVGGQ